MATIKENELPIMLEVSGTDTVRMVDSEGESKRIAWAELKEDIEGGGGDIDITVGAYESEEAEVTKTTESGVIHLEFGLPRGPKGETGETGSPGAQGKDGTTFTPSVAQNGDISWTNDGGKVNPQTVNIKGPQGETGATGTPGKDGTNIASITTQPVSYGGAYPYRIALETVEEESGLDAVRVGDILEFGYYHYPVAEVDTNFAYMARRYSIRGPQGLEGPQGADGSDGTTFTPAVSSAGVISWTNDGGKTNPPAVDLVAAVIDALPTWTGGAY